jgi:ubiquitin-conjugating enzyme E2 J1
METDARGQLGGLDTTEEVRRRLARESRLFKCSTCARSNGDIIAESEKQAKESSSSSEKVQIPTELSMGWRDEMETKNRDRARQSTSTDPSKVPHESDSDSAELAEGFVQTVPTSVTNAAQPQVRPSSQEHGNGSVSSGRPTEVRTPAPGGNSQTSNQALQQRQRQQQATVGPREHGVPLWVDRAIVGLVISLAALLLKVLFGI